MAEAPVASNQVQEQMLPEQPVVTQEQPETTTTPTKGSVKSKRLFVGNVAKSVDQEAFRLHFEQFGELLDCVLMKHRDEEQHRSFGFVHFQDEKDAEKVLGIEHTLQGRTLNINLATKRTKKFHVGRLSNETSADSVREYFEKYGEVDDIVVFEDRHFGFVTMVQKDNNLRELEENEFHEIDGKSCRVSIAKPNNFRDYGGFGRGRGAFNGGHYGWNYQAYNFGYHGFNQWGHGGGRGGYAWQTGSYQPY